MKFLLSYPVCALLLWEHCLPVCVLSRVQLFATPWTVVCQIPLSVEFSRQEYWCGLPFPSPGDLPDPGIEPASPTSPALAGGFFFFFNHCTTSEDLLTNILTLIFFFQTIFNLSQFLCLFIYILE